MRVDVMVIGAGAAGMAAALKAKEEGQRFSSSRETKELEEY